MLETKFRVANIIRFISMITVLAALLLMYAYGSDEHSVGSTSGGFLPNISKATIFYTGLGVFAIFNILMNWGIRVYRDATGFDPASRFFRSETHKAGILFWLTLVLAALNFLLSFMLAYIGFIKIEGFSAQQDYIAMPFIGVSLFFVVLIGLVAAIFRKE